MNKHIVMNPFEKHSVTEPRRIEGAVSGLNDKPLEKILLRFEELCKDQLPRRAKLPHAQFVVSPQPGYGKSHLIGRLFRKLSQQATLVYLRPFEDPATCWTSVLLKIVQELDFPDRAELEHSDGEDPTQLEVFAHGTLVHLIAEAVESGSIRTRNKHAILDYLHKASVQDVRKNKNWLGWVRHNYNALAKQCSQQLRRNGIRPNASPLSWIGVLLTCAYFPLEFGLTQTCLDWLKGGSVDRDEAKRIGITPANIPHAEMSGGEINELCKSRITDICRLAGFFRPFVFCFDQTENYGKEITLAKTLGLVIQVLTDETCNQMTVVTANQVPWTKSIEPWWEDAHRNRLGPPLELEGLNRGQAEELIVQRFSQWDADTGKNRFTHDDYLNQLFQGAEELGVRDFLQRCSNRWRVLMGEGNDNGNPTLGDHYEKFVKEIKTHPRRLVFDLNTLYWLVSEVAAGLSEICAEKYESQKGYFTLRWNVNDRQIFFGFEPGSNSSRWKAIAREAKIHYDANPKSKVVLFRTPELPVIPGPRWKAIGPVIEAAKKEFLHIMRLDTSEMEKLYAAHDLHIDAVEGNIPGFLRSDVLDFVRGELRPFWEQIKKPLFENKHHDDEKEGDNGDRNAVTKELIQEIRSIVHHHKLISVDDLMKKLSQPVPGAMFREIRGHIPEIRIHVSPNMTVLQWQSDKSVSPS